jgi:hypothetical protein
MLASSKSVALISQKLGRCGELIRFFVAQRLAGFAILDEPYLEDQSIGAFTSSLQDCRFYLEYGSGGSTVLAARLHKRFISVDTDPYFLESVRRKIGELAPNQHLLHADVGLTGPWGTPFWRRLTPRTLSRWTRSLEAPWRFIPPHESPDLVLIDGRFRVAATLVCCAHLATSPGTRIFVDDYAESPHYHALEKYATLTATVGRMAIFQPAPLTSSEDLRTAIAKYSADWR